MVARHRQKATCCGARQRTVPAIRTVTICQARLLHDTLSILRPTARAVSVTFLLLPGPGVAKGDDAVEDRLSRL